MKKVIKTILDYLPFDGSKTKISIIIAIIGVLKAAFPNLNLVWNGIIEFISSGQGLIVAGTVGAAVGVAHKKLKKVDG